MSSHQGLLSHLWGKVLVYGGTLTLLWLGLLGVDHLVKVKRGGLEHLLSDVGCYGGAGLGPHPCTRATWQYDHWYWTALVLGAVVLLAAGVAATSERLANPDGQASFPSD